MRLVQVTYRDLTYSMQNEVHTAGPYTPDKAEKMQACLAQMGCFDFKLVPHRKAA
jgi:hypothetical protein